MDKVIKEFKEDEFTYRLGYYRYNNRVYPCIGVYKNNLLFTEGGLSYGNYGSFYFSSYYDNGYADTIKKLFNRLREYSELPEEVEKEYENIFLLYKLNNFKEL